MKALGIKFRAKRKDNTPKNGRWVYGDLTHTEKITVERNIPCIRVGGCDIDESTIGQYVGRTDENDKEIYIGDIIEATFTREHFNANGAMDGEISDNCVGVVCFDTDFYMMYVKIIKGEGILKGESDILLCNLDFETMKVIGNIYDNPEMLTDKLRKELL